MTITKPDIVFVHGAFFTPAFYELLTETLERSGFDVSCPFLPTCADSEHKGVQDDLSTIRASIEASASQGRNVLVVMHSYGGIAGTDAVRDDLLAASRGPGKGGVVGLVYLCAMLVPPGGSVGSALGKYGWLTDLGIQTSDRGVNSMTNPEVIMNDLEACEIDGAVAATTTVNSGAVTGSVTHAPWKSVKTVYVLCKQDRAIKLELQEYMVRDARAEAQRADIETETLDTGHCPWFRQDALRRLVQIIEKIAAGLD